MKAIAVYPGMPHSMHLEEVPMPAVTDIPDGRGVLVDRGAGSRNSDLGHVAPLYIRGQRSRVYVTHRT